MATTRKPGRPPRIPGEPGTRRGGYIFAQVSADEKERILARCQKDGLTVSNYMRRAINSLWLEEGDHVPLLTESEIKPLARNGGRRPQLPLLALLLLLLAPAAAQAQPVAGDGLLGPWPGHEHAAQVLSNVTVGASVAIDTWASWQAADRRQAFVRQGVRTGVILGSTELVKYLVHRWRPDLSDQKSFYSEHTAFAASTITPGRSLVFTVGLTVGTAEGRIGGAKHYLTDTLFGALAGALAGRIR